MGHLKPMSLPSIIKIKTMLSSLHQQASLIDQQNENNTSFRLRKDRALFAETLFSTNSDKICHYIIEVQSKVDELQILIQSNKDSFSISRLSLIEQQTTAIINAIHANNSQNKASKQHLEALKKKRYQKATQSLLQPTQSLYQKLAETHEFERRLKQMLDEKQIELTKALKNKKDKITQELLVLHQRLGRCRQAISKTENQIELSEKR